MSFRGMSSETPQKTQDRTCPGHVRDMSFMSRRHSHFPPLSFGDIQLHWRHVPDMSSWKKQLDFASYHILQAYFLANNKILSLSKELIKQILFPQVYNKLIHTDASWWRTISIPGSCSWSAIKSTSIVSIANGSLSSSAERTRACSNRRDG